MKKKVIILAAGGHAAVLADGLQLLGYDILFAVDPAPKKELFDVRVVDAEDEIYCYPPNEVELVNGLGAVSPLGLQKRAELFTRMKGRGYRFLTFIHPRAFVSPSVRLGEGAQIMAGALLQSKVIVGENSIINTGAIVDHDSEIGVHCHISPGVVLSGGVVSEPEVFIGAGATVIQNMRIGSKSLIGAGAVVIEDIRCGVTALGVPAREVIR